MTKARSRREASPLREAPIPPAQLSETGRRARARAGVRGRHGPGGSLRPSRRCRGGRVRAARGAHRPGAGDDQSLPGARDGRAAGAALHPHRASGSSAREAHRIGFVHECVPAAELDARRGEDLRARWRWRDPRRWRARRSSCCACRARPSRRNWPSRPPPRSPRRARAARRAKASVRSSRSASLPGSSLRETPAGPASGGCWRPGNRPDAFTSAQSLNSLFRKSHPRGWQGIRTCRSRWCSG